jgi:methyltransferase (TIGR00027 family)
MAALKREPLRIKSPPPIFSGMGIRRAGYAQVDHGKQAGRRREGKKCNMTNPAAGTAYGPMLLVAAEQYYPRARRIVQDDLAFRFLPSGAQVVARLARWPAFRSLAFPLSERRARGVWGSVLCRKRFLDDKFLEAVPAGVQAVVNLGAGLDTRAYRFSVTGALPVFEADLPENIEYKRAKIRERFGKVPTHVHLVPVDFDTQDLENCLSAQGYQAGEKIFFIWEAVTQYLSEKGVRKTMGFLSKAGRGSRLGFTYIRGDFILGTNRYGLDALYGAYRGGNPIWHFGLAPEKVSAFLEPYGWKEVEQAGTREYAERYLQPVGRELPVTEIERAAYAEKE